MDFLKKVLKSLVIGSLCGLGIALFTNFFFPDLIDRLENLTYYMRYHWSYEELTKMNTKLKDEPDYGINIIDIDDRSQQKMGMYLNWDRSYHAKLINELSKQYPASIVFDIMFFDPEDANQAKRINRLLAHATDVNPQLQIPEQIQSELIKAIDYDQQLIDATRNAGNVIHGVQLSNEYDYPAEARSQIASRMSMDWHDSLKPSSALIFPPAIRQSFTSANTKGVIDGIFPDLAQAARDIGCTNMPPNEDGIVRAVPIVWGFGKNQPVYLPLSVRTVVSLFGTAREEVKLMPGKYLDIGKPFKISKDNAGNLTCSYPNTTPAQIKAILEHAPQIQTLPPNARIDITAFLQAECDEQGRPAVTLKAAGPLPAEVVHCFIEKDLSGLVTSKIGDTIALAQEILLLHTGKETWEMRAPYGDEEWYLSGIEFSTLVRIDSSAFKGLAAGQSRLLFHEFHVRNRDGILTSSLPVLRQNTLLDLCKTSWESLQKMPAGMRMDFGSTVRIPLTPNNLHILTFFGPQKKPFTYYSYYDMMNARVQGSFEGKIFVIGSSSPTQHDILQVAHDKAFPGVEVQASVMNSILTNTFITRLPQWQDFCILLIVGIIIGIIGYLLKPLPGSILTLIAIFVYFLLAMMIFGAEHIWIEIARPVLTIVLTFTAVMAYRYVTEEKDRRFLHNTFKAYLSPEIIDTMYKNKQEPKLGGEEGIRTAFFTDIQGFSTFSEKLGSPTRLVELLNEYLSAMTDILLGHNGTLDKYEGDAIIAFYGAPVPQHNHAQLACQTALDMQKKLGELRKKWVSEGDKWPTIVHEMRMRIGLNTGAITTGNMGSTVRMNYTMMGDAVNLAARLESAAKQYGVFTMISQYTYDIVKQEYIARQVDKIRVVGKSEPVVVFELMARVGELSPEIEAMTVIYNKGLEAFYGQRWEEAIALLKESEKMEPYRLIAPKGASPSKIILEYAEGYKAAPPPPDWDGVMQLTSK